jgi:putative membrane protein
MMLLSDIMFALVAVIHGWFLVLEVFLWNQGLYNGFLAAGVGWGLAEGHSAYGMRVRLFFGACIVMAGVFGAISTGKRTIVVVQALPALIAVFALLFAPSYHAP